jgi:hypothetical protein
MSFEEEDTHVELARFLHHDSLTRFEKQKGAGTKMGSCQCVGL